MTRGRLPVAGALLAGWAAVAGTSQSHSGKAPGGDLAYSNDRYPATGP